MIAVTTASLESAQRRVTQKGKKEGRGRAWRAAPPSNYLEQNVKDSEGGKGGGEGGGKIGPPTFYSTPNDCGGSGGSRAGRKKKKKEKKKENDP